MLFVLLVVLVFFSLNDSLPVMQVTGAQDHLLLISHANTEESHMLNPASSKIKLNGERSTRGGAASSRKACSSNSFFLFLFLFLVQHENHRTTTTPGPKNTCKTSSECD